MPWANGMRLLPKHPTKKFGSFSNDHGIGNYGPRTYLESSLGRVTRRLCHAKSLYNSGRVVQEAPLELWANVKQRPLDQALGETNKHSDIQLELLVVVRKNLSVQKGEMVLLAYGGFTLQIQRERAEYQASLRAGKQAAELENKKKIQQCIARTTQLHSDIGDYYLDAWFSWEKPVGNLDAAKNLVARFYKFIANGGNAEALALLQKI